ncbi:MAG: hypothetical protein O3A01_06050 [bacterium]|nr:hypothetical protein [bacterium]
MNVSANADRGNFNKSKITRQPSLSREEWPALGEKANNPEDLVSNDVYPGTLKPVDLIDSAILCNLGTKDEPSYALFLSTDQKKPAFLPIFENQDGTVLIPGSPLAFEDSALIAEGVTQYPCHLHYKFNSIDDAIKWTLAKLGSSGLALKIMEKEGSCLYDPPETSNMDQPTVVYNANFARTISEYTLCASSEQLQGASLNKEREFVMDNIEQIPNRFLLSSFYELMQRFNTTENKVEMFLDGVLKGKKAKKLMPFMVYLHKSDISGVPLDSAFGNFLDGKVGEGKSPAVSSAPVDEDADGLSDVPPAIQVNVLGYCDFLPPQYAGECGDLLKRLAELEHAAVLHSEGDKSLLTYFEETGQIEIEIMGNPGTAGFLDSLNAELTKSGRHLLLARHELSPEDAQTSASVDLFRYYPETNVFTDFIKDHADSLPLDFLTHGLMLAGGEDPIAELTPKLSDESTFLEQVHGMKYPS